MHCMHVLSVTLPGSAYYCHAASVSLTCWRKRKRLCQGQWEDSPPSPLPPTSSLPPHTYAASPLPQAAYLPRQEAMGASHYNTALLVRSLQVRPLPSSALTARPLVL